MLERSYFPFPRYIHWRLTAGHPYESRTSVRADRVCAVKFWEKTSSSKKDSYVTWEDAIV